MKMSSDNLLRFSSTLNYFGLFLIFVLIGHCSTVYSLRTGARGVCAGVTSSVQTFQGMRVQAQRVQVSKLCGWNTCHTYKVVFVPVYFTTTRTTYREQLVCCPGYTTRDNNISCEQFLVLGGPDPGPHSPGSSSNPSNPQNPNVIPGPETGPNVNGDPKVPTSNGPVPPVGPNNPGAGGPVVSPGNNNPVVPLPPNNPGNSGPGSSNGTIVTNGPSSPIGPGIPNEPVGPGRPTSGPGRSNGTLEPNNPILPGSPNNPTGTGPANEPVIPGSSPGNQNYPDRPPNQPIGPFNPNVDQHNPEVPSDPTNRGQNRPEVKPGQGRNTAGGLPNKDGIKRPDNAADDDAGNNANGGSHGPAESRGSVMLIFGILLVTMAIFTLTAIGISILKTRVNKHEELEDDQPRISIVGSNMDDLLPIVASSSQHPTASQDGPDIGQGGFERKVSTCTENDTDSGIVRISICEDTLADDNSLTQWKKSEARKTLARNKLRLGLSSKFASILGPYSFTDLRSIHEDTIRRSRLSSASNSSNRCLCNLPPTFCARPHSPVRKTANFFSSNENLAHNDDPPELTAYSYTAVDPSVGLSLSNVLHRKRNSLPLTDNISNHEYKELEFYDQFNDNNRRMCPKIGYDKLERPESRSTSKPEVKPKPTNPKHISMSGSNLELSTMGYNLLSRGAEQVIHKSPTMDNYYDQAIADKSSLLKLVALPSTKPKPAVARKPVRPTLINGVRRITSSK